MYGQVRWNLLTWPNVLKVSTFLKCPINSKSWMNLSLLVWAHIGLSSIVTTSLDFSYLVMACIHLVPPVSICLDLPHLGVSMTYLDDLSWWLSLIIFLMACLNYWTWWIALRTCLHNLSWGLVWWLTLWFVLISYHFVLITCLYNLYRWVV